ncbi:invasion associated locus B family protein [Taklimakanibacter deserti]|uniref:invasion associated locus B family protein n=1 Tax=Taklimakanibacter deserti TaxID=2267839 RepID=UPI0013C4C263
MPIFSKQSLRWAALTVATLLAVTPALAQDAQAPQKNNFGPRNPQAQNKQGQQGQPGPRTQQGPAPEVIATHGDWKIQCESAPGKANAEGQAQIEKQCAMVQSARSDKNAKLGLTTVFVRGKQNGKDVTMMRILAPIGVYLPTGVALEVDGGAVGRIPFMRCLPQICVAFGEAGNQTLDKFRKGTAANFIIYEAPGLGMPIKISLNGFAAAFTALGKL